MRVGTGFILWKRSLVLLMPAMVDLLSRAGNIEEAIDFVTKTPMEPYKRIWGALFAGCKTRLDGQIMTVDLSLERLNASDAENIGYPEIRGFSLFLMKASAGGHSETHKEMKKAILEVLLVNAEGIGHTNVVGTPAYYVLVQCGNNVLKSKVSSGKQNKSWWNEKFTFEFPLIDWKRFTHLKFRIMDRGLFAGSGFVGETIIYLGGIIDEGINREVLEMKPAAYNVVLEDDTYRGEIKIGFKFTIQKEEDLKSRALPALVNEPRLSICRSIMNIWKFSWRRLWCYCNIRNSSNEANQDFEDDQ